MLYRQHIEDCFAEKIGAGGLTRQAYDACLRDAAPVLDVIRRWHEQGSLPLLRLPGTREDLTEPLRHAERFAKAFDQVLVLGTGGSSLGGQTLAALADLGFGPRRGAPKLWFMDNVDPATFEEFFARIDLSRTGIIAISKSGGTAETLMQLFTVIARFQEEVGAERLAEHLLVITERKDNPRRRLGARVGAPLLDHDPAIGGR